MRIGSRTPRGRSRRAASPLDKVLNQKTPLGRADVKSFMEGLEPIEEGFAFPLSRETLASLRRQLADEIYVPDGR